MPEINSVAGQLVGIPVGQVYTAGKGVVIDNVNKTVRTDETVLFDGNGVSADSGDITEAYNNFEYLRLEVGIYGSESNSDGIQVALCSTRTAYTWVNFMFGAGGTNHYYATAKINWSSTTHFSVTNGGCIQHGESSTSVSGNTSYNANIKKCVFKIVGVNRIAGGN